MYNFSPTAELVWYVLPTTITTTHIATMDIPSPRRHWGDATAAVVAMFAQVEAGAVADISILFDIPVGLDTRLEVHSKHVKQYAVRTPL